MLSDLLADLRSLLFPSGCVVCGGDVSSSMHGICTMCRYSIPLTNFWKTEDNPTKEHFAGIIPLVHASSFFYFSHDSQWRSLIHRFKYGGEWRLAESFGRWYGRELRESGLYDDVDVVMPVPLHFIKAIKRGYNQSSYLAESIAREIGKPTDRRSVRRHRNNPPQSSRGISLWQCSAQWPSLASASPLATVALHSGSYPSSTSWQVVRCSALSIWLPTTQHRL